MKILLDIKDSKAAAFIELIKGISFIKAEPMGASDVELFNEIKEIQKAFKNAELIKSGKIKSRPVEDLLNEL